MYILVRRRKDVFLWVTFHGKEYFVGVRANLHTFCALNADPNDQLLI